MEGTQHPDELCKKTRAWIKAAYLIEGVVETWGVPPLVMANGMGTISSAQQHIDLIREVADWLMRKEDT